MNEKFHYSRDFFENETIQIVLTSYSKVITISGTNAFVFYILIYKKLSIKSSI